MNLIIPSGHNTEAVYTHIGKHNTKTAHRQQPQAVKTWDAIFHTQKIKMELQKSLLFLEIGLHINDPKGFP